MDEKGADPDGDLGRTVGDTRSKLNIQSDRPPFHVSLMITTRGGGDYSDERLPIPPGVVHVGSDISKEGGMVREQNLSVGNHGDDGRKHLPDDWLFGQNPSANVDKFIFHSWCYHFVKNLPKGQLYPVFLFLDHHYSRDNADALQYLKDSRIIVVFGPSKMTILWQMNDNGVNQAIESVYNAAYGEYSQV